MAVLKNSRHEMFAQLVARGKTQSEAYIIAGFSPSGARGNATRLIANDSISQRIQELQDLELQRNDESTRKLLWEINYLMDRATMNGQYHAAIKAMALKLRVLGMM